jgi:hypothetical protein
MSVDAHDGDEPATTSRVKCRNHPALGAQTDAVRRVFDVASCDDPPVVDESRSADLET